MLHGLPLIERQRQKRLAEDNGFANGHHFIGGSVQHTEISEAGVTQKIIHTWPEDVIGQPIAPRPMKDPPPAAPAGLSRQQRRAWEARRRKG